MPMCWPIERKEQPRHQSNEGDEREGVPVEAHGVYYLRMSIAPIDPHPWERWPLIGVIVIPFTCGIFFGMLAAEFGFSGNTIMIASVVGAIGGALIALRALRQQDDDQA